MKIVILSAFIAFIALVGARALECHHGAHDCNWAEMTINILVATIGFFTLIVTRNK